jgi:hypothetical protein
MWKRAIWILFALIAPAFYVAAIYGLASLLFWLQGRTPHADVMLFWGVIAYFVMLYGVVQMIRPYWDDRY